jgi:hypothetical protein
MLNLGNAIDRAVSFLPRIRLYLAIAAALVAVVMVARCDAYNDGKRAERASQAVAERKAAERARKADADAGKAVDETRATVEAGNQRARDAAEGSDDPLRDGLGALR